MWGRSEQQLAEMGDEGSYGQEGVEKRGGG
jgi:hypothetical protein